MAKAKVLQPLTSIFESWENELAKKSEPKYTELGIDPLTLVCSLLRSGTETYDIINYLKDPHFYGDLLEPRLEDRDVELANSIRDYFSKKHMLRRIKGDHISKWMLKVDEICEGSKKLDYELLPVLVTLPRYYEDNRFIEGLIKTASSAPDKKIIRAFSDTVEFVTKHYRKTRSCTVFDYYWKTSTNELVRARIPTHDLSYKAWDFVAKQGYVQMNFKTPTTMRLQGYDFRVYCANTDTEIENCD